MKPLKLIATHFDTKNKKYLAPYGKEGDAQIYLAYSSDGVNFTRTHYKFENIISLEQVKRIEPKQDKKEMLSFLEYVKDKSPELSGFIEKLGLESVLNDLPTPEEIVQKKLSKEKVMGLFLSDILPKIQKNIQEKAQEDPSTIVQILEEMQNMQSPEEDSEEDEEENVIIHNGKRYVLDQEQDEEEEFEPIKLTVNFDSKEKAMTFISAFLVGHEYMISAMQETLKEDPSKMFDREFIETMRRDLADMYQEII